MKSLFFDNQNIECNVSALPAPAWASAAKEFFRLSIFGHHENVIEVMERIKKNLM